RLYEQLRDVLARAAGAGVRQIITIGTDLDDAAAAVALARQHAQVRCAIGIHPNHVKEGDLAAIPQLLVLQKDPAVVALGEMGLDYFHESAPRDLQRRVFEAQLQLATELDRPVIIHCREAVDDTLAILRS